MKKILICSLIVTILSSCIGNEKDIYVENNIPTKTVNIIKSDNSNKTIDAVVIISELDTIKSDNNNKIKTINEVVIPTENDKPDPINIDTIELKIENIKNNISEELFNKINNGLKEQPFNKILEDEINGVHYSQDNIEGKSTRSLWIKNGIIYDFVEYYIEYDD